MAKTVHNYIPQWDKRGHYIAKCPFGERDLTNHNDECYFGNWFGNGRNRCRWFVRYEWCNEHRGCIHCTHPPVDLQQLELFPL